MRRMFCCCAAMPTSGRARAILRLRDYERAAVGMPDLAQARNGVARLRSQMVAGNTGASAPVNR